MEDIKCKIAHFICICHYNLLLIIVKAYGIQIMENAIIYGKNSVIEALEKGERENLRASRGSLRRQFL